MVNPRQKIPCFTLNPGNLMIRKFNNHRLLLLPKLHWSNQKLCKSWKINKSSSNQQPTPFQEEKEESWKIETLSASSENNPNSKMQELTSNTITILRRSLRCQISLNNLSCRVSSNNGYFYVISKSKLLTKLNDGIFLFSFSF